MHDGERKKRKREKTPKKLGRKRRKKGRDSRQIKLIFDIKNTPKSEGKTAIFFVNNTALSLSSVLSLSLSYRVPLSLSLHPQTLSPLNFAFCILHLTYLLSLSPPCILHFALNDNFILHFTYLLTLRLPISPIQ